MDEILGTHSLLRVPHRLAQLRGPGREQGDRLPGVPPGRGRADPEPRRELSERLAFPQLSQDQERLLPGFTFRQRDPAGFRCRRMIPAAKSTVLRDSGSAAR